MNKQMRLTAFACVFALAAILGVLVVAGCRQQVEVVSPRRLEAVLFTFQSAVVTDTNGAAMDVGGFPTIGIQVEGITTATITFEGTIDGSTWYAVKATNFTSGSAATTTTSDAVFTVNIKGLDQVRTPISGYSAGTITVKGLAITE